MAHTTAALTVAPPDQVQAVSFDEQMQQHLAKVCAKYPTKQAALLPVLWLCQDRWGWISDGMITAIADHLELSPAYIEGVVTFYTMYRRTPPGRYVLQVCSTLSCQLCGAAPLIERLKSRLGIEFGQTTSDGRFTLIDVQCLGACGEAPVIQVNDDYYSNLTPEKLDRLLDELT